MKYYLLALKNYAVFSGRSNRSEYWYFILFNVIFTIAVLILDTSLGFAFNGAPYGLIYMAYAIAMLIPTLAITVRRLHDTNKSGWGILISLIPFIGSLWLLIILASEGTQGDNRFGADPNGSITFDFESQGA